MKSIAYKRENGKVVELVNNNNTLEDMFLMAYNQTLAEIKRGRFTFTSVNLQDAITAIWERLESIELTDYQEVYHYLVSACSKREKYEIRQAISLDLMKDIQCEYFIEQSGISDTYISEVIGHIRDTLTDKEYQLFNLFHVSGYTQSEIAVKLETYQKDISRKLELIAEKIKHLKIAYFFDCRYVAYQSKSKRRYVRYEESIGESGIGYKLDKANYEPITNEPVKIPLNKALSYPTKQYYKTKREDFAYCQKDKQDEYFFISNLTLGHSKIKPHVVDNKKTIEYVE